MARKFYTDIDLNSNSGIINLKDGVNPQDAATVAQVRAVQEGLAQKDNVRVASTGNINLAAPGATIDGISMSANQAFLAKDQTSQAENGIYVWNGPSAAATRRFDADQGSELLSAIVTVDEGTANAGTSWRQTSVNITIGSTSVLWTPFGVVSPPASTSTPGLVQVATQAEVDAGAIGSKVITPLTLSNWANRIRKVSTAIGDASATQFDVTHNLSSNDVTVQVYRNSSPFDNIECDIERPSTSIARVRFSTPPPLNAFRVVVTG